MMIGVAIAKLAGKRFVGFIDADNFVPGSVHEYCKVYAAGLHYALQSAKPGETDPYAMVRINWKSKPKVKDGKLVFEESGRSSRVVNEWFNRLLNELDDSRTRENFIKTGNAGEHVMSLDIALQLHFATQYAVEPFQLIDAWEQFGGSKAPSSRKLRILQIRTCHPHFHDTSKCDGHIERMQAQGLGTIYYSRLASQALKDQLRTYMKQELPTVVDADGELDTTRVYPPLSSLDFQVFRKVLKQNNGTLTIFGDDTKKLLQ
jgi:mannosyl-3-phosphoglycerate synthase